MSKTTPDDWILIIENLDLIYDPGTEDEAAVFNNFDIRFRRGEFVAIVGPSGCGKTTLLDIIAGLLQPTAGQLQWNGSQPPLGYFFQEYPFLPRKTVSEHIGFPLKMAGEEQTQIDKKVHHWIEKIGLLGYDTHPLDALSVGMKARVALATVMIAQTQLLLLDEPFRSLDLETRINMWRHLYEIRTQRECTSILVTHDLNEAIALADRVIIMTPIPSRILSSHTIPFDSARDVLDVLESDLCSTFYRKIWADLRIAISSGNHQ